MTKLMTLLGAVTILSTTAFAAPTTSPDQKEVSACITETVNAAVAKVQDKLKDADGELLVVPQIISNEPMLRRFNLVKRGVTLNAYLNGEYFAKYQVGLLFSTKTCQLEGNPGIADLPM